MQFYQYQLHFPKKDRYNIGQKCEKVILEILESIILASQLTKAEKLPALRKASLKLEVLKVLFRLCKDIKILDNKKYLLLETDLQEIGRMLGGWIKASS